LYNKTKELRKGLFLWNRERTD